MMGAINESLHLRLRVTLQTRTKSSHIFCQNIKALNRYRPMNPQYQHVKEKKWVRIRGSMAQLYRLLELSHCTQRRKTLLLAIEPYIKHVHQFDDPLISPR